MDACDAEQARELVRALRDQRHKMARQLDSLNRQNFTDSTGQAAALRRDIDEAQMFISRLQRRYLPDNGDGHATRPGRPQAR
jgi:hypothetical protein